MAQIRNDSVYIQWQVIRNNSCFLRHQRGIKKIFSREPFNPKMVNSLRFNVLVNKSGVDIQPKKDGKGVQATMKIKKSDLHPNRSTTRVLLEKNDRRTLKSIKNSVKNYKPAHAKHCLRRTSQILRSQKTAMKKHQPKNADP